MIIQIGTEADESRILWKHSESDEWQRADIDDLIDAYESRPTGEWVVKDGETVCSLCGNSVSFSWTEDGWVLGKFCQTCGAKMRGIKSVNY